MPTLFWREPTDSTRPGAAPTPKQRRIQLDELINYRSNCPRFVGEFLRAAPPLRLRQCYKKRRIPMGRQRKCPRCVGELLRAEFTWAPLHRPRHRHKGSCIPLGCYRKPPRCIGENLRAELAQALLQCHKKTRIPLGWFRRKRPRRVSEFLRPEFTWAPPRRPRQ